MPLLTAGAFSIYDRHAWKQYTDRKLIQGLSLHPDSFALIDGPARGRTQKPALSRVGVKCSGASTTSTLITALRLA